MVSILKKINRITSNIKIPRSPPSSQFPNDVLRYMKKNAISNSLFKLIKTNKYFIQEKFPFYFLGNGTSLLKKNFLYVFLPNWKFYKPEFEELSNNLIFTGTFDLEYDIFLPKLISKTFVFDLKCLSLNAEKVTFNDFKFLTSTGKLKELRIFRVNVSYKNGESVPYEILLNYTSLLNILELFYDTPKLMSQKFVDKIYASNIKKILVLSFDRYF